MKTLFRSLAVAALTFAAVPAFSQDAKPDAKQAAPDMKRDMRAKFEASVKRFNDQFPGAFAAEFIDLTDNSRLMINPDVVMATASTIKVSILVELFRQAEKKPGMLQEMRPFKGDERTSRGGIAPLIGGGSMITLEDVARIMINLSENTATNILIDVVGMDNVNKNNVAMGLKTMKLQRKMLDSESSAAGRENITSVADAASLMLKIATCDLPVSKESCARIRAIMEIPQPAHPAKDPIPRNIPIAFKWGGLEGVVNGWGIVSLPGRPYIFIIMTNYGPANAGETVKAVSQLAFDYYSMLARSNPYGVRNQIDAGRGGARARN